MFLAMLALAFSKLRNSKFTEGQWKHWRTVLLLISNSTYFWYGRCF